MSPAKGSPNRPPKITAVDLPHLEGASCIGRHRLFESYERRAEAAALCADCPALAACTAWSAQRKHLVGTWAGRFRGYDDERTKGTP